MMCGTKNDGILPALPRSLSFWEMSSFGNPILTTDQAWLDCSFALGSIFVHRTTAKEIQSAGDKAFPIALRIENAGERGFEPFDSQ